MSASGDQVSPVLINDQWVASKGSRTFGVTNPRTREKLPGRYPVSPWEEIELTLAAADKAAAALRSMPDVERRIGDFLDAYAAGIEARAEEIVATAATETGLPVSPRLKDVELPRTTGQLRQAARAARESSWQRATIDTKAGLRSCLAPVGPVWVIGPNNFPFAFNGAAGGDFAAAIAAGNPVIAKGHALHAMTSRYLAETALAASKAAGLPAGTLQMLYRMDPADGERLIADPRLKAIGFTGSREAGLKLKAAADNAGKPFFGELSSLNPVVVLPGALAECGDSIVEQFATSMLMGTGQFCTKPGLLILPAGEAAEAFISKVRAKIEAAPNGCLFSEGSMTSLCEAVETLKGAGAEVVAGGGPGTDAAYSIRNTLLRVSAAKFATTHGLQTEAFGNSSLVVLAAGADGGTGEMLNAIEALEGNLTGTIYSAPSGADDAAYGRIEPALRMKVGRLINDKMPTGVAVSPAMNHGGPFPATSNAHFTAVGIPASILRFTQLHSYDNVREHRLPACLRNKNPTGKLWRLIDGNWTQADV